MSQPDNSLNEPPREPMTTSMNLKKQLKLYLDRSDMTASQLARKAGVPKQSISGWLAGNNPRDIRQVKKVADVFGISIDQLIFASGSVEAERVTRDVTDILGDDWIGGVFEVRMRRVKK